MNERAAPDAAPPVYTGRPLHAAGPAPIDRFAHASALAGAIALAAIALALTMTLAVLYAYARVTHGAWPSIPFMARWHGTANALAYASLGLLGWTLEDRR